MYVPQSQITDGLTKLANSVIPLNWIIQTAGDPSSLSAAIQHEIQSVDSQLAASKIRTMDQVISESTARQNFNMLLLTIFAGLALLLAAIGIYGLMSYTVEQRTQEIGIRMALGADRGDMLKLVVRQGMLLTGIGVVIGLAASFGLNRLLGQLAVRRESHRPDHLRRGSGHPGFGGAARLLHSRSPRHQDRPAGRVTIRIATDEHR